MEMLQQFFICFNILKPGLGRAVNKCVKRGSNKVFTMVIFPYGVRFRLFQNCIIRCKLAILF
jgi:hypothetical protein